MTNIRNIEIGASETTERKDMSTNYRSGKSVFYLTFWCAIIYLSAKSDTCKLYTKIKKSPCAAKAGKKQLILEGMMMINKRVEQLYLLGETGHNYKKKISTIMSGCHGPWAFLQEKASVLQ